MRKDKKALWLLGGVVVLILVISSYVFSEDQKELNSPADIEEEIFTEALDAGLKQEPLEISAEELEMEIPEELEFIDMEEVLGEEEAKKEGTIDESIRVNLIFKEAAVTDILGALAQQTGMNIIWGDEVKGIVSLRLEDVPWEAALDMVLKANKLVYEREENVIRVTTLTRLNEEKEALLRLEEAEKEKEPLVTEIVTLNFSTAQEVQKSLEKVLSKRGSIVVDARTNSLVITEIGSNMEEVKRVAMAIDTQTPQVMIESRIVETSAAFTRNLGIDWTIKGTKLVPTHWKGSELDPILDKLLGPNASEEDRRAKRLEIEHKGGSFLSNFILPPEKDDYGNVIETLGGVFNLGILDAYDFQITWEALQADGSAKILSNPRVATLHNREAYIVVGQKIPIQEAEISESGTKYSVKYEDVGTKLKVTATINKEDMVTLRIQPEVSAIIEWRMLKAGEYPIISTKEADVEVLVKSGDTVVIGGLIYEGETNAVSKIPFLGDIPLIGWAFKKQSILREQREILVFVTPTVFGREEKEKIAKELIDFEDELELIEKKETEKQEEEAFQEIEKELEEIEKEVEKKEVEENHGEGEVEKEDSHKEESASTEPLEIKNKGETEEIKIEEEKEPPAAEIRIDTD